MDGMRQRAESGSAQAQFEYANQLKELGREDEAVHWYEKAGRQGRVDAMYEAGNYYNNKCCRRDAFKWYKEASAEEYPAAMYELGNFYMLDWDCLRAVDLYIKAACKGCADALAMLTKLHNKLEEEKNGNISIFLALPLACATAGGASLGNSLQRRSKANECSDSDINRALGTLSKEDRGKLCVKLEDYFQSNTSLV